MSYMGLFWETGMPEAWALSRKSEERQAADAAAESRPQAVLGEGILANRAHTVPDDNAGRPEPKPDDGKAKG